MGGHCELFIFQGSVVSTLLTKHKGLLSSTELECIHSLPETCEMMEVWLDLTAKIPRIVILLTG